MCCMCPSNLTLCSPTDCSPPGSSDHGILPARTQEWLPCPPLRDLPDPGIETVWIASLALEGGFFTTSTPWEAPSLLKFLFLNIYWGWGWEENSGEVIEQPLKSITGASLEVQWVWLCASNARDAGWIPGWVIKMHMAKKKFFF